MSVSIILHGGEGRETLALLAQAAVQYREALSDLVLAERIERMPDTGVATFDMADTGVTIPALSPGDAPTFLPLLDEDNLPVMLSAPALAGLVCRCERVLFIDPSRVTVAGLREQTRAATLAWICDSSEVAE